MIDKVSFIRQEKLEKLGLSEFFEKTFEYFYKEIILLNAEIFEGKKAYGVLALIERAWIGVLNNAIIKAFPDNAVTLQEFGVYSKSMKLVGRADFLVKWRDKSKKDYYLLFEAKSYAETLTSAVENSTESYYKKIYQQAKRYYNPEIEYYKNKNVWIIPVAFGWIRGKKILEKADEYLKVGYKKDNFTDFCYLYHEGEEGMWVYGSILPPEKNKY